MSVDRLKYRLHSTNSQTSVNTDTFLNVALEGTERLLPTNDINKVVDTSEIFNKERQSTTTYRLVGTIKPIMSNVLFNVDGNYSWEIFNETRFKVDPYGDNIITIPNPNNPNAINDVTDLPLTFEESYSKHLKEQNGWFGYYNPEIVTSGACDFTTMEPQKRRFSFYADPIIGNNWDLTITYPWSADTTHYLVSDVVNGNGLKIVSFAIANVGDRPVVNFATATAHNLVQGDRVRLLGLDPVTLDGDYRVMRIGEDNGDNKEHYFSVAIPFIQMVSVTDARLRRLINGEESRYYIRLLKKVRTVNVSINNGVIENDDYEVYPTAFSHTIYNDEVAQFIVNEDIEVKDLTDNLGRPLSELFVTVIKTQAQFFTPIQVGFELGFVAGSLNPLIPNVKRFHDAPDAPITPQHPFNSPDPLNPNANINDDYYHGDIVEYNRFEQIEHVLSIVGHRFNTENRIAPQVVYIPNLNKPRQEGYYYYPHKQIKIRDFSNYIEQGDANTYGIPDYAEDLGDGRWLWRDLLDIGVNDGQFETLNYPYLNGSHYLYHNYCFSLRRQDPYGQYDLYYGYLDDGAPNPNQTQLQFAPYDIIGAGITDRFEVKRADEAC